MSQFDDQNPYQASSKSTYYSPLAAAADEWERSTFVRRTYAHLAGAIGAFIGLEWLFFNAVPVEAQQNLMRTMMGQPFSWLIVLGLFMFVSWIANSWAHSSTSIGMQYAGLGLYVFAEAIIFTPILFLASRMAPGAIPTAALITAIIFGGLTAFVFITKTDFSGLGKYLWLGGLAAMGYIAVSLLIPGVGLSLGPVFAAIMVALAAGYILYDTSNVMHHYRTTQYVAASLALFASVALLFWYVLRIVMAMSQD